MRKDETQAKRSSGSTITPAWRLAITLRVLAGGDPCGCADMANVLDRIVWPIIDETVDAIMKHFRIADFDVKDSAKLEKLESEFALRSDNVVRGCVGALDGMAVCIRKPLPKECGNPKHYYNRKGFFALNLQAICDANKRFLFFSVLCPGSTHDSLAFDMSSLGRRIAKEGMLKPYWIAADNAYRASEFIVVPWPGRNLDVAKDSFNFWLSNSRITIEGAFGILTQRWGIFWRPLPCTLDLSIWIIGTCILLHNLCIDARVDQNVEFMFGNCGTFDEAAPFLHTGGALWADQSSSSMRGHRSDLDTCPRRCITVLFSFKLKFLYGATGFLLGLAVIRRKPHALSVYYVLFRVCVLRAANRRKSSWYNQALIVLKKKCR